ncbi:MAG: hypothetical protein K5896_07755 [Prevotella sp.]|nr:hypothetical protein [Prevotella sp.]
MKQPRLLNVLLVMLTAGAVLTACSSDEDTPQQIKTYYMTVEATRQGNEDLARATRALFLDVENSTLNASWATSEHVYVQGTLYSAQTKFWFNGSLQPQSEGTTTRLNGTLRLPDGWQYSSIDDAISTPHVLTLQFPHSGDLIYTGQKGTLADIAENYNYATAEGVRYDIVGDHIEGVKTAEFVNKQAIVKFTLKDKAESLTLLNPTELTVAYGDQSIELNNIPDATYTTNGNGVLFVAIPRFSDKKVTLTAIVGNDTYTFTKNNVTFENSKYYEINVKMNKKLNNG